MYTWAWTHTIFAIPAGELQIMINSMYVLGPQMGRSLNTLYFYSRKFPRFACCMALWASCQYKREQWSSILFKSFPYNNGLLECSSGDMPCIAQLKTRHIECTKESATWYSTRRLVDRHTCSVAAADVLPQGINNKS